MQAEEALWTELIDTYRDVKADWVPDVVGVCRFDSTMRYINEVYCAIELAARLVSA